MNTDRPEFAHTLKWLFTLDKKKNKNYVIFDDEQQQL